MIRDRFIPLHRCSSSGCLVSRPVIGRQPANLKPILGVFPVTTLCLVRSSNQLSSADSPLGGSECGSLELFFCVRFLVHSDPSSFGTTFETILYLTTRDRTLVAAKCLRITEERSVFQLMVVKNEIKTKALTESVEHERKKSIATQLVQYIVQLCILLISEEDPTALKRRRK